MKNALFSSWAHSILYDAVWSGTTPQSTYSVGRFAYFRQDWRVKYPSGTATVTATLGASRLADVVAVPMSNIDPGSTVLALTNSSGLNVTIAIPALPADKIPLTAFLDLRGLDTVGHRTSDTWHWIATGNSVAVTYGACLWLGTAIDFTANFRPGRVQGDLRHNNTTQNFFGTVNRVRARTRIRYCEIGIPSADAQRDQVFEWARAGEGSGRPSLLCMNPDVNDAMIGAFPDDYSSTWTVEGFSPVSFRFTEFSKGIPLL